MLKDENRIKALDIAVSAIEKQFGKGSIMRLDKDQRMDIETIPSGSISLDIALGVGGYAKGRVTEIYGPESSGKTTLTLHAISECQKMGGVAAFIDAEHALDVNYARRIGVNTEELLISQPDTGEQALEIADMLVRSGAVDLIVIDSVAALTPKAEIEGEMGDSHMGLQARLMSQALRKLTGSMSKSKTAIIFINQIRHKIGVMFGSPETTTGGNALKFYASVRIDVRKIGQIKLNEAIVGNRTKIKISKNKLAAPFQEIEFDITFGEGISTTGDILDMAVKHEIVQKSGTWYNFGDEKIGQGRENAKVFLAEHPTTLTKIAYEVRKKLNLPLHEADVAPAKPEKPRKPKESSESASL